MDIKNAIKILNEKIPKGILETQSLKGNSSGVVAWIDKKHLLSFSKILKEVGARFEGVFAAQVKKELILSYGFNLGDNFEEVLMIRSSLNLPDNDNEKIANDGIGQTWEAATPNEAELADLFGISMSLAGTKRTLLPDNWIGYPLRKQYVFPMEFLNLAHVRPKGRTEPDEFGLDGGNI